MVDPLLTVAEAARRAGVAYNTIVNLIERKELIPVQSKPHTILIRESDIDSLFTRDKVWQK